MDIENLNKKTLREFKEGDTLYISKMESGYQVIYFCEFLKLYRGVVIAKTLSSNRPYWKREDEEIRSRANKCLLWGYSGDKVGGRKHYRCHWFKNLDSAAE